MRRRITNYSDLLIGDWVTCSFCLFLSFIFQTLIFICRVRQKEKKTTKTIKCVQQYGNKKKCVLFGTGFSFFSSFSLIPSKGETNQCKINDLNKFWQQRKENVREEEKMRWNYFNLFLYFIAIVVWDLASLLFSFGWMTE